MAIGACFSKRPLRTSLQPNSPLYARIIFLLAALTTEPIDNLSKFQRGIASNNPISIFDALVDSSHALATDQRDKVYGVRGLSFMAKRFIPTPSYIGTVEDMCFRTTLHIFRNTKSLDIIPLLGSPGSRPGLLSWVPPWTNLGDKNVRHQINYLNKTAMFAIQESNYMSRRVSRRQCQAAGTSMPNWEYTNGVL